MPVERADRQITDRPTHVGKTERDPLRRAGRNGHTASGEAFFLGQGYGTEDMVQPPEIISNAAIAKMMGSAADFGRKLEMAHYQMAAFGTLWNVSGGQCHGVHWTSA